jgi:hypothetical protein
MTKETRDKPVTADLSNVNSKLARKILNQSVGSELITAGFGVTPGKPLKFEETV